MNFELKKISQLSGKQASVYTVFLDDAPESIFHRFLADYQAEYNEEINDIVTRLKVIGQKTGARAQFFKPNEGEYGDLVEALYDDPEKKLRLYCMRFGGDCIILGGGGPKTTRTWQEDENLAYNVRLMITMAKRVHQRFTDGDLKWASNYKDMSGDLVFKEEDDE